MAIERELRLLLQYARLPVDSQDQNGSNSNERKGDSPKRVAVRDIYDRLKCMRYQNALPSVSITAECNIPELLVLAAEAAVYQQDFDVARACVEWFLSDCSTKNQFFCRIQLVRAHCSSVDAANDVGAARLKIVLNAIRFILLVIPIATDAKRRPQYDFLVYNASVTYWQISRQLMKKSTFQYLLPSLSAIVDALKAVGEKDVKWLVRLQLALVHAQIDAKQLASAAKTICDVVDVQLSTLLSDSTQSNDPSARALDEEALRLLVHIGSFKDPECQKILANTKKSSNNKRLSLITKLQALKSGAFAGTLAAALTEIFQEATGMTSFSIATSTNEDVIAHVRSLDITSANAIDVQVAVEAGIVAAFRHEYRFAACCDVVLQTRGKGVDPKSRVLHQIQKAILVALVPPTASANFKLSRRERARLLVTRRLEGVKAIERAMLACKRQQDPTLMENVCLYAWNLSLPLLQPTSRDHLSRLFSLASSSLEELQSLQLNMRARLMFELGKLELSSKFFSKAQEVVGKALALDYGTIITSAGPTLDELLSNETKWLRRPLDVHLQSLQRRLKSKLASEDPVSNYDKLAFAVGQLRDTKDPSQRKRDMDCVLSMVELILEQHDGSSLSMNSDLLLHLNTASAIAWFELKDVIVARRLTSVALRMFYSDTEEKRGSGDGETKISDKSEMVLEVDLRLRMVELIGHELKTRAQKFEESLMERYSGKKGPDVTGKRRAGKHERVADGEEENTVLHLLTNESFVLGLASTQLNLPLDADQNVAIRATDLQRELTALKIELLQQLTLALRAATRIGWLFVIENTAIYLWNFHFHVFRMLVMSPTGSAQPTSVLPECIAVFEMALAGLEALPPTSVNLDLLANVALGLALTHENSGKLDKAVAIADSILKRTKASSASLPTTQVPVPTISLALLKQFGELKVRIQIQQNAKEIVPVDVTPQVKVASYLEATERTLRQVNGTLTPTQQNQLIDKASNFFQKAFVSWQSIASESIETMRNETLNLEDQQQQLELYCELWVRLGCAAFRFHNTKQAIDFVEHALDPVVKGLDEEEQRVWVTTATWKWLAIAELLYARSILALLSGETAAWTLLEATLIRLVQSTQYASRGNATSIVIKAGEIAWNTTLTAIFAVEAERATGECSGVGEEARWWSRLVPRLRDILQALMLSTGERSWLLGDFGLLVLDICERANEWKIGSQLAERLISTASEKIQSIHLNEITTYHAIATASSGNPSGVAVSSNGGKGKDRDALTQTRILRKIAFSTRHSPPAQLQALTIAFSELDGKPEEQALILVDMAECFLSNQFPMQEVHSHLATAHTMLIRARQAPEMAHSSSNWHALTGGSSKAGGSGQYSPLWYADKLVRVFTMKAAVASSVPERCSFLWSAMQIIFDAWQCIVGVANEEDLKERFALEKSGNQSPDFEEWKQDKPAKYTTKIPRTTSGWIAFYQQYATSPANRFYLEWVTPLCKREESLSVRSISNAVLTCSALERLALLVSSVGLRHLLLPIVCLYQVVYYGCCLHKSKSVEIWIELTMYDVLETLNLPALSIPLQTSLELLQSSSDKILSELQQQEDDLPTDPSVKYRHRAVLQQHSVSVSEKVTQAVDLLLQFGYLRQAKVLLAMLENVAARPPGNRILQQRCEILHGRVSVLEGDSDNASRRLNQFTGTYTCRFELRDYVKLVLLSSELTADHREAVDKLVKAERVTAAAIIKTNECDQLNRPMHAQGISKYLSSLKISPPDNLTVDIDAIEGLAQLKFRHACLLIQSCATATSVEHAVRTFREAVELLRFVHSSKIHADFNVGFAQLLVDYVVNQDSKTTTHHNENWLLEARTLLREALLLLECVRSMSFESGSSLPGSHTIPLDVDLGKINVMLAELELRLNETGVIIAEQQMTWYKYEKETKHNIVDKWLDQTAKHVEMQQPGNTSSAFALATAGICALARAPEPSELRSLAQTLQLKCQRLDLYHSQQQQVRESTRNLLWTRFTSEDEPHAKWICAASIGSATEDGRSTPVSLNDDATTKLEPQVALLQNDLAALAAELENALKSAMEKRYDRVVQISAYELAMIYGCSQPVLAARSLLLYQSTVVRQLHMKPLVEQCLASTNATKLHMHRLQRLTLRHTSAFRNSLPFQLSQLSLEQQSDIYKRMSVSVPVETVLATLPANARVLSLQLSPDRCFLFAVMVTSGEKGVALGRMECTTFKLDLLSSLTERSRRWREGMSKALLSGGDLAIPAGPGDIHEFTALDPALEPDGDVLEQEFSAIVEGTMQFLGPLFEHTALKSMMERELPGNALTLLVDRELDVLPLEAMPMFDKVEAISREFSVHLLYHRLSALKTLAFRKDDVRVVVDPRHEDPGLNDSTLTSVFHQYTKKPGAVFANWKDAAEHGHAPTTTDWQHGMLLRKAGALVYAGPNRIVGSAFGLHTLAGMNLGTSCYALLLLDRGQNQSSARRQSKLDSDKSRLELTLDEDPFACALLCSLCGVNTVLLNQWTTTFNANRRLANGLLGGLTKGQSIAKALRKYAETASPVVVPPVGSPARKASTVSQTTAPVKYRLKNRIRFNTTVYGLGHLAFKASE